MNDERDPKTGLRRFNQERKLVSDDVKGGKVVATLGIAFLVYVLVRYPTDWIKFLSRP